MAEVFVTPPVDMVTITEGKFSGFDDSCCENDGRTVGFYSVQWLKVPTFLRIVSSSEFVQIQKTTFVWISEFYYTVIRLFTALRETSSSEKFK